MIVGRNGGTGTLALRNGSSLYQESTSGHADDSALITVGHTAASGGMFAGHGSMIVEDSDVYVDGGADFAGIYFGREADTTGVVNFSGADTGVIVTSDNQAGLFISRDGRADWRRQFHLGWP